MDGTWTSCTSGVAFFVLRIRIIEGTRTFWDKKPMHSRQILHVTVLSLLEDQNKLDVTITRSTQPTTTQI